MINRKKDYPSLGIDIGGTKIASALDLNGALYEKIVLKTPAQASQEEILEALVAHINKYRGHHFREIGIGIPGLVDTAQGIVYNLANIPSFQEVNIKSYLENVFDVPVFINNDANCFVLAEHQHAAQYQHLVGITLGTGIGTGIIANSKLYGGHICGAGEWGAVSYLDKTYEEYCSGKFFLTKTGESSKRIYKNALNKEPLALDLFREYGQHLGNMINQIMFILAPEAIVLGGSISKAYPLFEESLMQAISTFPYKSIRENLSIYVSTLEDSAIHGAIALTQEMATIQPQGNES